MSLVFRFTTWRPHMVQIIINHVPIDKSVPCRKSALTLNECQKKGEHRYIPTPPPIFSYFSETVPHNDFSGTKLMTIRETRDKILLT